MAIQRATDLTGVLMLKHEDRFLLTDAFGDIHPDTRGLGFYRGDRVGEASVDPLFHRSDGSTAVEVLPRIGDLTVIVQV